MRLLILLALALPTASAASPAPSGKVPQVASPDCRDDLRLRNARRPGKAVRVAPLGEEPTATAYRAVYREVEGCPTPAVLREEIVR